MKLLKIIILLIAINSIICSDNTDQPSGVMGKIKSSLQLASKMLGLDRATGVAQLVSETFGGGAKSKKGDNADEQNQNLFSGFFRLLGLDSGKLGAIVINGFILLAQMISKSFKLKPQQKVTYERNFNTDLPIDWFTNNKKIKTLLDTAKNKNLPDKLIEYIQDKTSDEELLCVQLLICKSSPFIWGMQKTISNSIDHKSKLKGSAPMFATMPTVDEVADHGDECDKKYPLCRYLE